MSSPLVAVSRTNVERREMTRENGGVGWRGRVESGDFGLEREKRKERKEKDSKISFTASPELRRRRDAITNQQSSELTPDSGTSNDKADGYTTVSAPLFYFSPAND